MLLSFTTGNYCCFKEKQTLSLQADGRHAKDDARIDVPSQALHVAGIYGDIATGKSHFCKALRYMRSAVSEGWRAQVLHCSPFLLDSPLPSSPSFFEVLFVHEEVRYRYGFEILAGQVLSEWCYERKGRRESRVFSRHEQALQVGADFLNGRRLVGVTPSNMLLLCIAGRLGFPEVMPLMHCFQHIEVIDAATADPYTPGWEEQLAIPTPILNMNQLYQELGIDHMMATMRAVIRAQASGHRRGVSPFNDNVTEAAQASRQAVLTAGTRSLLAITPAILKAINEGGILFIDDLDAHLSIGFLQSIVRLFQDQETNPVGAQFIFTTHLPEWLRSGKWLTGQRYILQKPLAAASLEYWSTSAKVG